MSTGIQRKGETLPSGRVVDLAYPPLYSILSTLGTLPTAHQVAILDALRAEGAEGLPETTGELERLRRVWVSNYVIASLCLVRPRLVLDREPGPGEWGERDLPAADAEAIRIFFRWYHAGAPEPLPRPDDAGGDQGAEPGVHDLPGGGDAQPVPQGRRRGRGVGDR